MVFGTPGKFVMVLNVIVAVTTTAAFPAESVALAFDMVGAGESHGASAWAAVVESAYGDCDA